MPGGFVFQAGTSVDDREDRRRHPLLQLPQPWAVLRQGAAPTVAHWLDGALEQAGATVLELDPQRPPAPNQLDSLGALVVVRTLPRPWLASLCRLRARGCPVLLLLDDDLLTPSSLQGLPWRYRWRLWWGLTRHRRGLDRWLSGVWVSTEALRRQCEAVTTLPVQVLPLQPAAGVLAPPRVFRIAYLGTTAHQRELAWLLVLFQQLQQRRSDCLLELVVDRHWRARFRGLPRVRLLYPMDWETFCLDTGNRRVDLMLAPLLKGSFNSGRAPVKVFDARRLGAVGLYSDRPPYRGCVRDGVDGVLLPDDPQAWLGMIDALLADPVRCQQLVVASCQRTNWSSL